MLSLLNKTGMPSYRKHRVSIVQACYGDVVDDIMWKMRIVKAESCAPDYTLLLTKKMNNGRYPEHKKKTMYSLFFMIHIFTH